MFLLAAHTLAWQGKRRKADARAIELLSEQLSERTRILKSFYDYAPADVIALVTHDNDQ